MTLPPHTLRALLVSLALMLLGALAPVSASAAEKGIETDLTWGLSNSERTRTVADVNELGAGWMRVTMSWNYIETSKGSYDLGHYDNAIDKAADANAKLLVTVYTTPSWASGSSDENAPPRDPADYADFMRFAANRWGDKVDAWEIWNEQNLKHFWKPGPNPAAYAELLKAAYPAVKSADPTAPVLFGGVSYNDYEYIEAAYEAEPNLGDYYDIMATHPYTLPNDIRPEAVWAGPDGRVSKYSFSAYREVRDVMLAYGDDKPLWFTEFGWSTSTVAGLGVSQATQADFYTRAMRCIEQDPYVDVAIWYIYRNHGWAADANTWVDQLGLVYTDFSRKQAFNSFKSYTPGTTGCTYGSLPTPAPAPAPAPEPTPEPEPEPEPEATDSTDEPESDPDGVESSSVSHRVGLRLVRAARLARASADTVRHRRRTAMRVRGRVFKASRGNVQLRMTCRGRGDADWRRDAERKLEVRRTGRFTRRIKPRAGGSCRLRARYRAFGVTLARSRLVHFRT